MHDIAICKVRNGSAPDYHVVGEGGDWVDRFGN